MVWTPIEKQSKGYAIKLYKIKFKSKISLLAQDLAGTTISFEPLWSIYQTNLFF
jgi:hypothetical protein